MNNLKIRMVKIVDEIVSQYEDIMGSEPERLREDKSVANIEKLVKTVILIDGWDQENDPLLKKSDEELKAMFDGL